MFSLAKSYCLLLNVYTHGTTHIVQAYVGCLLSPLTLQVTLLHATQLRTNSHCWVFFFYGT